MKFNKISDFIAADASTPVPKGWHTAAQIALLVLANSDYNLAEKGDDLERLFDASFDWRWFTFSRKLPNGNFLTHRAKIYKIDLSEGSEEVVIKEEEPELLLSPDLEKIIKYFTQEAYKDKSLTWIKNQFSEARMIEMGKLIGLTDEKWIDPNAYTKSERVGLIKEQLHAKKLIK